MELRIERVAAGGEGVGREPSGRVVFVRGTVPGDLIDVTLTEEKDRFARGSVAALLEPSSDRATPPCAGVAAGCGGCDFQHITPPTQVELKLGIIRDALGRIGRVADPLVLAGAALGATDYRTTVRAMVENRRAAYRVHHGHDGVAVEECLVAHPALEELLVHGRFGDAKEVTLRVGARTGERMAVVSPTAGEHVSVPDDVRVVGTDELRAGRRAWYHEEVAGRRWRISALSFFQARPDGADELVRLVSEAAGEAHHVIDLYGGVGLFAGSIGAPRTTVVESNASACADARVNLADLTHATIVPIKVEHWRPSPADVVVADPARTGLGKAGAAAVVATNAPKLILVSCDAAALGRDAGLLIAAGYTFRQCTVVDLFPHTSHVEAVSIFEKPGADH